MRARRGATPDIDANLYIDGGDTPKGKSMKQIKLKITSGIEAGRVFVWEHDKFGMYDDDGAKAYSLAGFFGLRNYEVPSRMDPRSLAHTFKMKPHDAGIVMWNLLWNRKKRLERMIMKEGTSRGVAKIIMAVLSENSTTQFRNTQRPEKKDVMRVEKSIRKNLAKCGTIPESSKIICTIPDRIAEMYRDTVVIPGIKKLRAEAAQ